MGASLLAVAKSIYYWSKKERARGNVTQYLINKQAYEIFFIAGNKTLPICIQVYVTMHGAVRP